MSKEEQKSQAPGGWIGFVAGVASGFMKNLVGHAPDSIKVRLQTDTVKRYNGVIDCCVKTYKTQGVRGFYLGFTPPLVGWLVMDSVMLGSLHNYRRIIKRNFYPKEEKLDLKGLVGAGVLAGWTVSFIAAPIELAKVKLQTQYGSKTESKYSGPIAVIKDVYKTNGLGINGLFKGLISTLIFRTNFITWWGSYELITRGLKKNTNMNDFWINFTAGGASASAFYITAYPSDVVKSYLLADDRFNGSFKSWKLAAKEIYQTKGWKGFTKGFTPAFIRAFPANAAALAAFETVLRVTGASSSS
ncbi:Calcium-binding mitochondrial carrier protein [Wickerhamomyces ciferrii]|uniref:Calcium-binding mitochondrial carrier protein n=1 Tax=Wickerhamomyces ciferrii (strain ATCC 14091 / BCRC 22168 / CBS 111 / JCM 3599 / NBRC 0793 / NRRL Y-1031 F-60-10) TaxID=1206466 RepID=K0KV46_WICCF|nr:Calcium-binding mitochondrial carrier protein [Wickerhamomyces ciferrii]CCH45043.1 Calcium-binding mitochondrial carrier protein [Wickerhamomyces ciferrii]